jgi:hypothetical protein
MRGRVWSVLRIVFGLAGLFFIVFALVRTIDRSNGDVVPSWPAFVGAEALALAALVIGSRAWTALFVEGTEHELRRGFYLSQLGKYIPGAIWQAVALVGSAARTGAGVARSTVRFPVYLLTTIAAGGTVGAALVIVGSSVPAQARYGSLAALLTIPLLSRRGMLLGVGVVRRVTGREIAKDSLPPQDAILRSYLYGLGSVLAGSAAFAVLLASFPTPLSAPEATTAFSLAWIAGFIALPFPSGIGIREAVLIGILGTGVGGPVVSAAIAQRIVLIIAELLVLVSIGIRNRVRVAS